MNLLRSLPLLLALLPAIPVLHAETPEERAKAVRVTMNLTDVPPGAVAHFVEVVSNVKIHYVGHSGDQTVLTISFENSTADEALKEIARLANLELTYQLDGAHFAPKK